ncbi:hypothetical protein LDL08_33605 [Nonomuraea glycinis]|nr:hypothetical protein [Nonomuraea glycinis]MCA2181124.1 hypothetical protein [Nonomuraea glycinis]
MSRGAHATLVTVLAVIALVGCGLAGSAPVAAVGAGIWHGQSFPGPG